MPADMLKRNYVYNISNDRKKRITLIEMHNDIYNEISRKHDRRISYTKRNGCFFWLVG